MWPMTMLVCFALSSGPASPADSVPEQRYQRSEVHMGTTFGIVLYAADEAIANRAFDAAFARIAQLDRICSDYDLESELSRLSAMSPTTKPVPVSDDLFRVLRTSQELSIRSQGAFDITCGPITKLWRRARVVKKLPEPDRLKSEMESVGFRHLKLHDDERSVELQRKNMRLDLGGIAKGYASAEALGTLQKLGIRRALTKGSGDISVGDPPPGEKAWRIEIAPLEPNGKPAHAVWLTNAAISTSGDAFQYLELAGQRYSHIVDPRTGNALSWRSSVSVIAPSGAVADGLATAISVLGPVDGLKLVDETPGAAAFIVGIEGESVRTYSSSRFADFTKQPQ